MLGVGLKNAILIILIILIIHFAIKNSMLEKFTCSSKPVSNLSQDKENLMKYVFGDDRSKDSSYLDSYFKDISKECKVEDVQTCNKKQDDHSVILKSTCDPNIQSLPPTPELTKKPPCNDKRDIMILNEYEEDKKDAIGAFDDFDMSYQSFKCEYEKI